MKGGWGLAEAGGSLLKGTHVTGMLELMKHSWHLGFAFSFLCQYSDSSSLSLAQQHAHTLTNTQREDFIRVVYSSCRLVTFVSNIGI